MTKFDEWFESAYSTAMQYRDWQTCEYLLDFREHIEYGFNKALQLPRQIDDLQLEIHVDGVKGRL
jgi:hypothetical protein